MPQWFNALLIVGIVVLVGALCFHAIAGLLLPTDDDRPRDD